MGSLILRLGWILSLFFSSSFGFAGGVALRFGPPSVGSGGPNPISIPPAFGDMGIAYITDKGVEYNLAATGFALALRDKASWGGYTSLGGGFAWSVNGGGIGPYAAFGFESGCGSWVGCFSMEFSQALGFGSGHMAAPTALRMGIVKWF